MFKNKFKQMVEKYQISHFETAVLYKKEVYFKAIPEFLKDLKAIFKEFGISLNKEECEFPEAAEAYIALDLPKDENLKDARCFVAPVVKGRYGPGSNDWKKISKELPEELVRALIKLEKGEL